MDKVSDYNLAGYNFKENKHVDAIGLALFETVSPPASP
jgi:hypothetical protein